MVSHASRFQDSNSVGSLESYLASLGVMPCRERSRAFRHAVSLDGPSLARHHSTVGVPRLGRSADGLKPSVRSNAIASASVALLDERWGATASISDYLTGRERNFPLTMRPMERLPSAVS